MLTASYYYRNFFYNKSMKIQKFYNLYEQMLKSKFQIFFGRAWIKKKNHKTPRFGPIILNSQSTLVLIVAQYINYIYFYPNYILKAFNQSTINKSNLLTGWTCGCISQRVSHSNYCDLAIYWPFHSLSCVEFKRK